MVDLKQHQRIHRDFLPFTCDNDDKSFPTKTGDLKQNKLIHIGMRHFECKLSKQNNFETSRIIYRDA